MSAPSRIMVVLACAARRRGELAVPADAEPASAAMALSAPRPSTAPRSPRSRPGSAARPRLDRPHPLPVHLHAAEQMDLDHPQCRRSALPEDRSRFNRPGPLPDTSQPLTGRPGSGPAVRPASARHPRCHKTGIGSLLKCPRQAGHISAGKHDRRCRRCGRAASPQALGVDWVEGHHHRPGT
jgi:hypothetical protein